MRPRTEIDEDDSQARKEALTMLKSHEYIVRTQNSLILETLLDIRDLLNKDV